jgi:intermediate peptidase
VLLYSVADVRVRAPAENVTQFLETLLDHTRPRARAALRTLSARKQAHLRTPPHPTIHAWDRDYYCPPEPPAPPLPLPPLTLGTVVRALSRLFARLYGVTLQPAPPAPGELWHADVRKLAVVDEHAGPLGWIYADLFARRGKASGAAHYAVRCSRRVDDDDGARDLRPDGEDYGALERVSREFEARGHHATRDGVFQLPVVALLTEFARPSATRGPTVLEWHEVLTLYHEMGHAMHCAPRFFPSHSLRMLTTRRTQR